MGRGAPGQCADFKGYQPSRFCYYMAQDFFAVAVEIPGGRTSPRRPRIRLGRSRVKESTMKYLLLIYANESGIQSASQEQVGQMIAAYGAYTEATKKAGVHVDSNRLRPASAGTTVRVRNGKTEVLDGPYAETKEQLGGYYMIDVPDLDAALSWAARCPGASHGTMEVRPIWTM
jgi:hypothetical protein